MLGATDFIDGVMARREGPTKFGSLIDPVADKIFMAAIVLSMVAIEVFPAWVASALLSREFLMTALRSCVAIRKAAFNTSILAKLKTIIQMGGSGTIFLTIALPEVVLIYACLALSLSFFVTAFIHILKRGRTTYWAIPVGLSFLLVALVEYFFGQKINLTVQMSIILTITWASAIDYLMGSYRLFKKTGMFFGDWSRIAWALTYGLLLVSLVADFPFLVLPILVSISFEFCLGGIDNIVAFEKGSFSPWSYYFSTLSGLSAFIAIVLIHERPWPLYISLALALVSILICSIAFTRHVDLFRRSLL